MHFANVLRQYFIYLLPVSKCRRNKMSIQHFFRKLSLLKLCTQFWGKKKNVPL